MRIDPDTSCPPRDLISEPCPLCGDRNTHVRFPGDSRPDHPHERGYLITQSSRNLIAAIRECQQCDLGFLPRFHYRPQDRYEQGGVDEVYLAQAALRIRNAGKLLDALPPLPAGARLLDVGAGAGFLLEAARQRGFDGVGVEPAAWAAAYAEQTFGVRVLRQPIESLDPDASPFDVVILADVIEHLEDPGTVLAKLRQLLKAQGVLAVLTPDAGSGIARLLGRHWWGLLDDHYYYFSRRSIRLLLARHNFEVLGIRTFGRIFAMGAWLWKLSQYSERIHRGSQAILRALGLNDMPLYVNLGDQMLVLARARQRAIQTERDVPGAAKMTER